MRKRRVVIAAIMITATIGLTGCSNALKTFVTGNGLTTQIDARVNSNIACVDKLYTAGLLKKDKAQDIKENIKDNGKELKNSLKDAVSRFSRVSADELKSITGLRQFSKYDMLDYARATNTIDDGDTEVNNIDDLMLSNYLIKNGFSVAGWTESYGWYLRDNVTKSQAADIVSLSNSDLEISNNFDLYVLDSSKLTSYNDTGKVVDSIKEIFDNYTDESGKLKDGADEKLAVMFKKVDSVKLFDGFEADNLICTTKAHTAVEQTGICGYDFEIQQGGQGTIRIRLNEFDQEAVDNLISMVSSTSGKYILNTHTGKAYLVEYPVSILDTIETDGSSVTASLKSSEIGVNVRSGDIIKYVTVDGQVMPDRYIIGNNIVNYESYLKTYGSDNEQGDSCSSFCIYGDQTVKVESGYKGQPISEITATRDIQTAGIILRDYLEATYAPDCIDSESEMVVFGRKFRFGIQGLNADGKAKLSYTGIARMVDMNGDTVLDSSGQAIKLNADQLMDLSGNIKYKSKRGESNYKVKRLKKSGETNGQTIQEAASDISSPPKITELKVEAEDSISPVLRFPGEDIDTGDNPESPEQPVMYTVGTCMGIMDNGLYANWIGSTSPTNSLSWWNTWLSTVGFTYNISNQDTTDYLTGNYSYELTQNGLVALDLDTVNKIQQDIDSRNKAESNKISRTIFKLLGVALIAYGMILMGFWTIDTQLGIGVDLYRIASFGKWQAIKYRSDIPVGDKDGKYVALGRMLKNSMTIIGVGTVIINVNIVTVIYKIVASFGKFAEYITNIF